MAKLVETASLVTEVVGDTKTLFELQLKLVRAEIRELAALGKRLALLMGLALAALVPAVFFLGLALSAALAEMTGLSSWACHLILASAMLGGTLIAVLRARRLLKTGNGE